VRVRGLAPADLEGSMQLSGLATGVIALAHGSVRARALSGGGVLGSGQRAADCQHLCSRALCRALMRARRVSKGVALGRRAFQ
jgi:hypothetical protein